MYGTQNNYADWEIEDAIWYISDREGGYNDTNILSSIGYPANGPVKNAPSDTFSNETVFNYPNPFNPDKEQTKIRVCLSGYGEAKIQLFDTRGDLVWDYTLSGNSGENIVLWNGKNKNNTIVANGVYLLKISAEGKVIEKKVAVLR